MRHPAVSLIESRRCKLEGRASRCRKRNLASTHARSFFAVQRYLRSSGDLFRVSTGQDIRPRLPGKVPTPGTKSISKRALTGLVHRGMRAVGPRWESPRWRDIRVAITASGNANFYSADATNSRRLGNRAGCRRVPRDSDVQVVVEGQGGWETPVNGGLPPATTVSR